MPTKALFSGDSPLSFPHQDPSALDRVTTGYPGSCPTAHPHTDRESRDGLTRPGTSHGIAAFTA